MQEKVYFEYCTDCRTHRWSTYHDESKYNSYFESCKSAISESFPEMIVLGNVIPPSFQEHFLSKRSQPKPWEGKASFPRIGSFEIYYSSQILFSKLCTGHWPNPSLVVSQLKQVINKLPLLRIGIKSKSVFRESTPTSRSITAKHKFRNKISTRPIINIKTKRKNNTLNNKSSDFTREKKSSVFNQYRKTSDLSGIEKYNEIQKQLEFSEDRIISRLPKNRRKSELSETKRKSHSSDGRKRKNNQNREVTKRYEMTFPLNKNINKKIAYANETDEDAEFHIWSLHRGLTLQENLIRIPAGEKVKIKLKFAKATIPAVKTYILNLDRSGKPWETIEFTINYNSVD